MNGRSVLFLCVAQVLQGGPGNLTCRPGQQIAATLLIIALIILEPLLLLLIAHAAFARHPTDGPRFLLHDLAAAALGALRDHGATCDFTMRGGTKQKS